MITRGSIEEQVVKLGARKREMFDQMITAGRGHADSAYAGGYSRAV